MAVSLLLFILILIEPSCSSLLLLLFRQSPNRKDEVFLRALCVVCDTSRVFVFMLLTRHDGQKRQAGGESREVLAMSLRNRTADVFSLRIFRGKNCRQSFLLSKPSAT